MLDNLLNNFLKGELLIHFCTQNKLWLNIKKIVMLGAALAAKSRMLHIKLPSRKRFKIRFIILDSETEFRKSIL